MNGTKRKGSEDGACCSRDRSCAFYNSSEESVRKDFAAGRLLWVCDACRVSPSLCLCGGCEEASAEGGASACMKKLKQGHAWRGAEDMLMMAEEAAKAAGAANAVLSASALSSHKPEPLAHDTRFMAYARWLSYFIKKRNKKPPSKEAVCFLCKDSGSDPLFQCRFMYSGRGGRTRCPKVYHEGCLTDKCGDGANFICASHRCAICEGFSEVRCLLCPSAFCAAHISSKKPLKSSKERSTEARIEKPHKLQKASDILCGDCVLITKERLLKFNLMTVEESPLFANM
jgi:hypothetical protein